VDALVLAAATRHGVTRGVAALGTIAVATAAAVIGGWAAGQRPTGRRLRFRG
jgi:hypothetical protein